jgi:3-phosphoglycerate kinase
MHAQVPANMHPQLLVNLQGLDIGPESLKNFQAELQDCKSVIWNGPMGVFEMEAFAKGTFGIAHTLAALSNKVSPDTSSQLRVLL